jgi:hypothetical protein
MGAMTRKEYVELAGRKLKLMKMSKKKKNQRTIVKKTNAGGNRGKGEGLDGFVSGLMDNLACLAMICKARKSKQKRCKVLGILSDKEIRYLRQIAQNFLDGNIAFKPEDMKKLRAHKKTIRSFAYQKNTNTARELAKQSGGFLGTLIPMITSLATPLLGPLVKKLLQ